VVEHALQAAFAVGLEEERFWTATPYQTRLMIEARSKRAYDQAVTVAWMSAKFSGMKTLEPLRTYLRPDEEDVEPKAASADEIRETLARFKIKPDRKLAPDPSGV
jgi:hypothetical protein